MQLWAYASLASALILGVQPLLTEEPRGRARTRDTKNVRLLKACTIAALVGLAIPTCFVTFACQVTFTIVEVLLFPASMQHKGVFFYLHGRHHCYGWNGTRWGRWNMGDWKGARFGAGFRGAYSSMFDPDVFRIMLH